MDFYTSIAPYYDDIFPYDGIALDFILRSVKHAERGHTSDAVLAGWGRYLDLGCATGSLALHSAPFFQSVDALDLDPELIKIARHKLALEDSETQNKVYFLTENIQNSSSRPTTNDS